MLYCYEIGGLRFLVDTGTLELNIDRRFAAFSVPPEDAEPDFRIRCLRESLPEPARILSDDTEYTRYLTASGKPYLAGRYSREGFDFGICESELDGSELRIYCGNSGSPHLPGMLNLLSRCGLHSLLLRKNMPVLHAAYVDIGGSAVLFTGHSGMGKSTQALLWQTYAGAETVNGDRALLKKENGVWYACGYPASGSSRDCLNRTLPLKAIILLEQGKENLLVPAAPRNTFRLMTAGTELFRWSEKELDLSLKLALRLAEEAAVYRFACRPDASAVETLKRIL